MNKRKQKVHYYLDSGGITHLEMSDIKAILCAADELIAIGGRSMLSRILKGSKDKKVLDYLIKIINDIGNLLFDFFRDRFFCHYALFH